MGMWNIEVERNKRLDYVKKFDYFLMTVVLAITAFGLVFLQSAMFDRYADNGASAMKMQIACLVVGILAALVICFFDYGSFRNFSFPFFVVNLFAMLLVFVPGLGDESGGSLNWIRIAGITYQPAELMKFAMIIVLAKYLERAQEEGMSWLNLMIILGSFFLPLGLVFLQQDFGMALVFFCIFAVMVFVGKMPKRYLISASVLGAALMPFIWKFYFNGTRRERFLAFLDPEKYADSYAMQLVRSLSAIGSGQLFGQGINQGPMNTNNKILVKMTDMIFSVIGEEAGFLGAMFVVVLMTVMLLRMIYISAKARDVFGQCLAAGVFAMFAFNIFENLGMNVGIMPITGLPLPFISKGGSAMITNYIALGCVLSISMRRKRGMFRE